MREASVVTPPHPASSMGWAAPVAVTPWIPPLDFGAAEVRATGAGTRTFPGPAPPAAGAIVDPLTMPSIGFWADDPGETFRSSTSGPPSSSDAASAAPLTPGPGTDLAEVARASATGLLPLEGAPPMSGGGAMLALAQTGAPEATAGEAMPAPVPPPAMVDPMSVPLPDGDEDFVDYDDE